jgi:hypothetical protein
VLAWCFDKSVGSITEMYAATATCSRERKNTEDRTMEDPAFSPTCLLWVCSREASFF